MIIKVVHLRRAGMCVSGTRKFFHRHGLNWRDFVRQGIAEEKLAATKDAMALRLIEVAHGK